MLQEENYPHASPAVLDILLDETIARKQPSLSVRLANQIIEEFTETDYALDARMLLADQAISEAAEERQLEKRQALYDTAIRHLGVVRAVYATTPDAAKALSILGRLYAEQGKYKEADACYKDILGAREWKQLWPEALYGRGECAMRQRAYLKASAYFERIYVMYGHYLPWAAKGYLRRAEALNKGHQKNKARETLGEMLSNPDLKPFPEYARAEILLKNLGR
jgi:tetratricopeptide (TPR) repeat protein